MTPLSVPRDLSLRATLRDYWRDVADVAAAIDLARGSSIPIYIFSLRERGNIKRALLGEDVGSIVSDENP